MLLHELSVARSSHVRLPTCPECGDMLLAPLLAEHVHPGHVRNHWVCEACGHSFRKSFKLEAADADEAFAA